MPRTVLGEQLTLNRSTIGSLAAELAQLALVAEQPAPALAVGRPSLVVAARTDSTHVLVADVTLHGVTAARVGLGGALLDRVEEPHEAQEHAMPRVVDRVARLFRVLTRRAGGSRCVGVAAAVPGIVRGRDGLVRLAPNLGWSDEPFGERLARRLRRPVSVGNDADLGARAEHIRGAAVGADDVLYLSGQVGLGGGIVSGGRPLSGTSGYAGELGHLVLNPGGRPCRCGSVGCWETEVNEQALLGSGRFGSGLPGVRALVAAARDGDPEAAATVERVGRWLGLGVAGLVNVLNPQVVVFGGHLATLLPDVRLLVEGQLRVHSLAPSRAVVRLVEPGLGQHSTLLGAAELAFTALLDDPAAVLAPQVSPEPPLVGVVAPAPPAVGILAAAPPPTRPPFATATRRTP